jgi:hypothetical protein
MSPAMRQAETSAAPSPWTRPPERPARYRLSARLSDMAHGWLDGRCNLPRLPEDLTRPANGSTVDAAERHLRPVNGSPVETAEHRLRPLPGPPAGHEPKNLRPRLGTSRMDVLIQQGLELIEGEKIRFGDEWAELKRETAHFLTVRDALARKVAGTEASLKQAQVPLSDEASAGRRFAERDAQKRPDELVRARRQAAWERRLASAEQRHQSVVARLAEAERQFQLRDELIRDRAAVARAAARRHHELAMRRIATYLQQLVRTHDQGADLNMLLVHYPVGPELPPWTSEPEAGQSGIEQMFARGSAPMTSDPYLRSETSGL